MQARCTIKTARFGEIEIVRLDLNGSWAGAAKFSESGFIAPIDWAGKMESPDGTPIQTYWNFNKSNPQVVACTNMDEIQGSAILKQFTRKPATVNPAGWDVIEV